MPTRRHALLLIALSLALLPERSPGQEAAAVALVNATVVDVERGVLVPRQTIITSRGRIRQVGPVAAVQVPPGATRVDLAGRFVIPGLWDMHVHVGGVNSDVDAYVGYFGSLFLANGVTAVRDGGSDAARIAAMDSLGESRPGLMPRVVWSGEKVGPASGASWSMIKAQQAIDARLQSGAGYVKLVSDYPAEHFRNTAGVCAAAGVLCVAHVPPADTSVWLSAPGTGSFEHLFNLGEHVSRVPAASLFADFDEYLAPTLLQRVLYKLRLRKRPAEPQALRLAHRDTTRDAAFFGRLASSGRWITPTLVLFDQLTGVADLGPAATDTGLAIAPLRKPTRTEQQSRADRANWSYWTGIVRGLQAARVPMLAGTDFSGRHVPGAVLQAELGLLQQDGGIPAADVLRMATINPARYFGATDSLGSVAAGRVADLVVLRANPLDDVRNVAAIEMVMTRGLLLRRPALDSLTSRARASLVRLRAAAATSRP